MDNDPKLAANLPEYYREMHGKGLFLGDTWRAKLQLFTDFMATYGSLTHGGRLTVADNTILDFGCGPQGGLSALDATTLSGRKVIPFDPYVHRYAGEPWGKRFDTFFSCDVFEHLPTLDIFQAVVQFRKHIPVQRAFIVLSTRAANKCLPNGMNAHLTVKSADWWRGVFEVILGGHFDCPLCLVYPDEGSAAFGFTRKAIKK